MIELDDRDDGGPNVQNSSEELKNVSVDFDRVDCSDSRLNAVRLRTVESPL